MNRLSSLVDSLRNSLDEKLHYTTTSFREAVYGEFNTPLDSLVTNMFSKALGIEKFYSHQTRTRDILLSRNKNVVLCTPTASGKTASFNTAIFETLLNDSDSCALYLYPMNDLSADQVDTLERLNNALPQDRRLSVGLYNRSATQEQKNIASNQFNNILVTTPDSLHYIFLPRISPDLTRFFSKLRYLVIDEAHVYRGIFGANVANIIRRLLIKCKNSGHKGLPKIIICSATIKNPLEHATNLTGLPIESFELVSQSGSQEHIRHDVALEARPEDVIIGILRSQESFDETSLKGIMFCRTIVVPPICQAATKRVLWL